jgi:hypothetical protein
MLKLNLVLVLLFLNVSLFADERVAPVTCAVISETTLDQSAYRVKEVNEARSKLNLDPYLEGDDEILLSIKYDLCILLIMDFKEYKKESRILVLAEKEEIERRRKAREKAEEEERKRLWRELEETARKEKEERERKSLQERLDAKSKVIQEFNERRKNVKSALNACDLPNDSTNISISKNKSDLSLTIFLDFAESVERSCPSLISGSREVNLSRRELIKGESETPLTQKTKDKLSKLPVNYFFYEVKIDNFDNSLILNASSSNGEGIFNIKRIEQENSLLSGIKSVVRSVGLDGFNKNGRFPYASKGKPDSGIEPFFTKTKDLRKVKVEMIREVSLIISVPKTLHTLYERVPIDYPPLKKVIYARDTK